MGATRMIDPKKALEGQQLVMELKYAIAEKNELVSLHGDTFYLKPVAIYLDSVSFVLVLDHADRGTLQQDYKTGMWSYMGIPMYRVSSGGQKHLKVMKEELE